MKKSIFYCVLLFVAAVCVCSCSKDEEEKPVVECPEIIGKWVLVSKEPRGYGYLHYTRCTFEANHHISIENIKENETVETIGTYLVKDIERNGSHISGKFVVSNWPKDLGYADKDGNIPFNIENGTLNISPEGGDTKYHLEFRKLELECPELIGTWELVETVPPLTQLPQRIYTFDSNFLATWEEKKDNGLIFKTFKTYFVKDVVRRNNYIEGKITSDFIGGAEAEDKDGFLLFYIKNDTLIYSEGGIVACDYHFKKK